MVEAIRGLWRSVRIVIVALFKEEAGSLRMRYFLGI